MKHGSPANGQDFTLCGVTLDGDPDASDEDGSAPELATSGEQIDCKQCGQIINHCRRAFTVSWRVR